MRPTIGSRRADEFEALLSGSTSQTDSETGDLLTLVAALRAVPEPVARPAFVADLRTQLVAAAEREPARAESELAARLTPTQRRGSRERRLAALVGGFAVVSATGSMAMASQGALPGDVLYPVKRAIENAQTNLTTDDAARADAVLAHAGSRLEELTELTARDADASTVNAALQDFADQLAQARDLTLDDYASSGDKAGITALRSFAADSMDVLGGVAPVIPTGSRPMLITATQTVRMVDTAAWEACPTCAGGNVVEVPDWALLRLSEVLSGDVPDTATAPDPVPAPPAPGSPAAPPSVLPSIPVVVPGTSAPAPAPAAPTPSPTRGTVVGDTVDKITDTLKGVTGTTPQPAPSSSPTTVTGTLVDGVGGLLGGLLGGK